MQDRTLAPLRSQSPALSYDNAAQIGGRPGDAFSTVFARISDSEALRSLFDRLSRPYDTAIFYVWRCSYGCASSDPILAILAESDGCSRQIVRYGKYAYGFQAHMEFTREIIAAGIEEAGESLTQVGRFVQTKEQLLTFDYAPMNALLSSFLDAMTKEPKIIKPIIEVVGVSPRNL